MQDTLLIVFTGILAFAVLLQSLVFFGIYRSIRRINDLMNTWSKDMLRNVQVISSKIDEGFSSVRGTAESLKLITQNLSSASQIIHDRVVDLDQFIGETTRTARLEFMHIQDTFQLAIRRAEEAVDILKDSILAPVNEATAVVRAVRTGLDVLFRRRKSPSISAQDDEMFI